MKVLHWIIGTIIVLLGMASILALGFYYGIQKASAHFKDVVYGWSFKHWLYYGAGGLIVTIVLFFIFYR